jgi:OOP family OmpA-OmpF porin
MPRNAIFAALATGAMLPSCGSATLELQEPLPVTIVAPRPAPAAAPTASRVTVEQTRIRVDEKIHFEENSSEISAQSDSLLREIAAAINASPHVRKIRIEGHTDSFGEADYNRDLSRRRARAVLDRLVQNGVSADRLESRGYGHTQPVAPNHTEEGRAQNRRVELNILEQDAAPGSTGGSTR